MKKLFLSLLGLCCSIVMSAAFPYMVFSTLDGSYHSIGTAGLQIKFNGTNIEAANSAAESLQLPLSQLVDMQFSQTASIEGVKFNPNTQVRVYDTAGICKGTFASKQEAFSNLSDGIYIFIDSEGNSLKSVVKK